MLDVGDPDLENPGAGGESRPSRDCAPATRLQHSGDPDGSIARGDRASHLARTGHRPTPQCLFTRRVARMRGSWPSLCIAATGDEDFSRWLSPPIPSLSGETIFSQVLETFAHHRRQAFTPISEPTPGHDRHLTAVAPAVLKPVVGLTEIGPRFLPALGRPEFFRRRGSAVSRINFANRSAAIGLLLRRPRM